MTDDKKQDAEREVDDQEDKAERGDNQKQGSTDSGAAPADDDIIIK